MTETFFNTIHLSGEDLKNAVANCKKQEEAIYKIFQATGRKFTASDITRLTEKAGKKWPIWSNRRAITNLCSAGKLYKSTEMKTGPMNKPEHFYKLSH